METSLLIPMVIHEIMDGVGYCGSCMGGCSEVIRFICLGHTMADVDAWIKEHPEKIDEWEKEMFEGI